MGIPSSQLCQFVPQILIPFSERGDKNNFRLIGTHEKSQEVVGLELWNKRANSAT